MTDEDVAVAERHGGRPFPVHAPDGGEYRVKLVASDADAYDRFYNIIANPMLWFIQHYLWDLSNAPDIRRNETEAFEFGYNAVNEDLARAVLEEIEGVEKPVVMVHDYHLYTLPGLIRRARPDAFLHHFVHIPWSQSDSWRVLPVDDPRGALPRDPRQRHHRLPHALLPAQLPAVLRGPARARGRPRARASSASTAARCGSAPTRCRSTPRAVAGGRPARARRASSRRSCCAAGATT